MINSNRKVDNDAVMEVSWKSNWNRSLVFDNARRQSELCKAKDVQTDWYHRWCMAIGETPRYHRKQWEYIYIIQSLWERGCLEKGKKGLVFAVGTEPLPSVFASMGCDITATDIHPERGTTLGWTNKDQLCFGLDSLNTRGLCGHDEFLRRVTYQPVDMNHIPDHLRDYDFNWSSCSFEHLGSIQRGFNFLRNQLKTLQTGGWAVHTTEYNISSNDQTMDNNESTVIFRQRDIDSIVEQLRSEGHYVERLDYSLGGLPEDYHVDLFPYKQDIHLRLQLDEYVATSIGLIIQKGTGDKVSKGFLKRIFS